MRDYGNILDISTGLLLIAVLVMAWLLFWCYLNPDETLAADNWKSIVTGGLAAGEQQNLSGYYAHPRVNGHMVQETSDRGCLGCHDDLP